MADKREKEKPGTFQLVMDEVYQANKIPKVVIPQSVISGLIFKRKRESSQSQAEEEEEVEEEPDGGPTIGMYENFQYGMLPSLPVSLAPTPAPSPMPSPQGSPVRGAAALREVGKKLEKKEKKKKKGNPECIFMAPTTASFFDATEDVLYKEIRLGKSLKYIYQNEAYSVAEVKELIEERILDVKESDIYYVKEDKFKKIRNGQYLKVTGRKSL